MAKMTMHQELDSLRNEVETLKKQKKEQEKLERQQALEAEKQQVEEAAEAEGKVDEIMESLKEGEADAKETFNLLLDTVKNDYKNLSPTSAIVLFALGAAFGNALSSK